MRWFRIYNRVLNEWRDVEAEDLAGALEAAGGWRVEDCVCKEHRTRQLSAREIARNGTGLTTTSGWCKVDVAKDPASS